MRTAIFADLHDNEAAFNQVLEDATDQGVKKFVFLGDVGRSPTILNTLRAREIPCVFGNWEVGQLERLPLGLQAWVAGWPARLREGDVLYCHATPNLPADIRTAADLAAVRAEGKAWLRHFPRLDRHEGAVWDALAVMEEKDLRVIFHGHTHVQAGWIWQTDNSGRRQLRSFYGLDEIELDPGPVAAPTRYLIGVGSAGQPEDGSTPRYALYESKARQVTLCRLPK